VFAVIVLSNCLEDLESVEVRPLSNIHNLRAVGSEVTKWHDTTGRSLDRTTSVIRFTLA